MSRLSLTQRRLGAVNSSGTALQLSLLTRLQQALGDLQGLPEGS